MYLGYQDGKIKFYTEEQLDQEFYNLYKVEETNLEYVLDSEEYVLKDEAWEEKQAQAEKERIAMLSLTRGDVFRGLLLARGVTRIMLRDMIETHEQLTELQKEMALIDFDEALNFYRGNALIDTVGLALGIEPAQLDCFFETNDYTCLLPKVEPEEPVKEEEVIDDTNNSTTTDDTDVPVQPQIEDGLQEGETADG